MRRVGGRALCALSAAFALAGLTSSIAGQSPSRDFSPPRVAHADVPSQSNPQVLGGGEVLIEAVVSRSGGLMKPVVLRSTPPFDQMMMDAVARWQFLPGRASNPKTKSLEAVDAPILIAAIFRPPTLYDGPTLGDSPRNLGAPSSAVASPVMMTPPVLPPNAAPSTAMFGATVLFEVLVDESGRLGEVRPVVSAAGYDGPAREALNQWRFRPARREGRAVPAMVYVVFGFRTPVQGAPRPRL